MSGNLAFELIQDNVYAGLDVGPGIAPDEAFVTIELDDNFHGIVEPFLGNYDVDFSYLIKELT